MCNRDIISRTHQRREERKEYTGRREGGGHETKKREMGKRATRTQTEQVPHSL